MGLTVGKGPFGHAPAGRFDFDPPTEVTYVEPFPRRVRGIRGGEAVIDSEAVQLVHRSRQLARWSFPAADVHVTAAPDPAVPGNVVVEWGAVDEWFEEDEPVFVHVRDPYHRIDCFSTSRRVQVLLDDVVLADTTAAVALYETGLPVRYYLPPADVAMELLRRSDTTSECPYKGTASYWSAEVDGRVVDDLAWGYPEPLRESEPVEGYLCFYDERVGLVVSDA